MESIATRVSFKATAMQAISAISELHNGKTKPRYAQQANTAHQELYCLSDVLPLCTTQAQAQETFHTVSHVLQDTTALTMIVCRESVLQVTSVLRNLCTLVLVGLEPTTHTNA